MSDFPTRLLTLAAAFGPALPIGLLLASIAARRGRPAFVPISFVAGALAPLCVFAVIVLLPFGQMFHSVLGRDLFKAFATAGLPEETAKFCLFLTLVLRHEEIDPERDAVTAGGWLGLGFAMLENFFYVTHSPNWLAVASLRAATAVPGHVAFGLVMGTLAARAVRGEGRWLTALAVPVVLHGLYDMALMTAGDLGRHTADAQRWYLLFMIDLAVMALLVAFSAGGALAGEEGVARTALMNRARIEKWQAIGVMTIALIVLIVAGLIGATVYMVRFNSEFDWPLSGATFLPLGLIALWLRSTPQHARAPNAAGMAETSEQSAARLSARLRTVASRPASAASAGKGAD